MFKYNFMARVRNTVQVEDLTFAPYMGRQEIAARTDKMAATFVGDYQGRHVRLMCIEEGARTFCDMFIAAVLRRDRKLVTDTDKVCIKSYEGTSSSGKLNWKQEAAKEIDPTIDLIVLEDIVDSGRTGVGLQEWATKGETRFASFGCIALLDKKSKREVPFRPYMSGFVIPDLFVVGFGLDYEERGRDLPHLYAKYDETSAYPFPRPQPGEFRKPPFEA